MEAPKYFNPEPYPYHHELELTIETLTNRGIGLARHDEWVVMIPFALPGEKVKAKIFRNHKNYSEADLVEVIEPSPLRVDPVCPLFQKCGGCQYQHFDYAGQLEWKRSQVVELFEKLAGVEHPVQPTYPSPKEYNYRSKLTPHFDKPRKGNDDFPIGFLVQGQRRRLVDVPQCPIATEAINEALPKERKLIRENAKTFKKGKTILFRHTVEGVETDNRALVSERIGDVVYQFHAGDFFQNNPFILPGFVEYILGEACEGDLKNLVDAYCGVGVFALAGSKQFEKVIGVEVNASAVQWANGNAAINQIKNCEFFIGQAEAIFKKITFDGSDTAMIIDPPRAGCDEDFIRQLLAFRPKRLVYVSCDPATQARDLKMLVEGGYAIKKVQPFDLFPQTRHIENVVTMDLA